MEILIGLGILVGAALLIYVWVLICKEFQNVAERKGFPQKKYFWITLFLGVIGMFLIMALPDRGIQNAVVLQGNAAGSQPAVLADELPDL